MRWTARRLPITVDPLPAESLDSWLEAYARRLRSCSRDLLDHLGLTDSTLTRMVTILTEREREVLAATTGIAPDVLTGMTLAPFDGVAVTIDQTRRVVVHPPAWRRQTGSRYCPACLQDSNGRWLLTWRLPWAFACPVHAGLLVDHCPSCGKRPTPHRPGARAQATIAGRCTVSLPNPGRGGWRAQVCGHALTHVPTRTLPAGSRVAAAQQPATPAAPSIQDFHRPDAAPPHPTARRPGPLPRPARPDPLPPRRGGGSRPGTARSPTPPDRSPTTAHTASRAR